MLHMRKCDFFQARALLSIRQNEGMFPQLVFLSVEQMYRRRMRPIIQSILTGREVHENNKRVV
jgi:hypothetical protein